MKWLEEDETLLRRLWEEGLSCRQIADKMDGRTRNAIIGQARRLDLPRRAAPGMPRKKQRARSHYARNDRSEKKPATSRQMQFKFSTVARMAAPEPFTPRVVDIEPLLIGFARLKDRHCRFICNDDPPYLYCGHPRDKGTPYCAEHRALCWRGLAPAKRAA